MIVVGNFNIKIIISKVNKYTSSGFLDFFINSYAMFPTGREA